MNKYVRNCPTCDIELFHTDKRNRNAAIKKNTLCRSCRRKEINARPENKKIRAKFIERYCTKGANAGENNSFYGKKHSEEVKNKLKLVDKSYTKTVEFKEKISICNKGVCNPMFGKNYYQVWVEKYGKEEADIRQENKNNKHKILSSGKGNPMYGKPVPQGAGNGWSGWYKGWFFRSLKELSYVINILETEKRQWISADYIKINYMDYKGENRIYHPDFLVDNRFLVEVKPEKLKSTPLVLAKSNAAQKYCLCNDLEFVIIDPPKLSQIQIRELYNSNSIKFIDRYDKIYKEKYDKI